METTYLSFEVIEMKVWNLIIIMSILCIVVTLSYGQWDMMFWIGSWKYEDLLQELNKSKTWIYSNWIDIKLGNVPILQISVYNSFCLFGIMLMVSYIGTHLAYAFYIRHPEPIYMPFSPKLMYVSYDGGKTWLLAELTLIRLAKKNEKSTYYGMFEEI